MLVVSVKGPDLLKATENLFVFKLTWKRTLRQFFCFVLQVLYLVTCIMDFNCTEYTQSGNGRFLADDGKISPGW